MKKKQKYRINTLWAWTRFKKPTILNQDRNRNIGPLIWNLSIFWIFRKSQEKHFVEKCGISKQAQPILLYFSGIFCTYPHLWIVRRTVSWTALSVFGPLYYLLLQLLEAKILKLIGPFCTTKSNQFRKTLVKPLKGKGSGNIFWLEIASLTVKVLTIHILKVVLIFLSL